VSGRAGNALPAETWTNSCSPVSLSLSLSLSLALCVCVCVCFVHIYTHSLVHPAPPSYSVRTHGTYTRQHPRIDTVEAVLYTETTPTLLLLCGRAARAHITTMTEARLWFWLVTRSMKQRTRRSGRAGRRRGRASGRGRPNRTMYRSKQRRVVFMRTQRRLLPPPPSNCHYHYHHHHRDRPGIRNSTVKCTSNGKRPRASLPQPSPCNTLDTHTHTPTLSIYL
jgi:hypothetical protein